MRKLLLISGLLLVVVLVSAQGDYGKFAYGFGVAGGEVGNRGFVIGLPFYSQPSNTDPYSTSGG